LGAIKGRIVRPLGSFIQLGLYSRFFSVAVGSRTKAGDQMQPVVQLFLFQAGTLIRRCEFLFRFFSLFENSSTSFMESCNRCFSFLSSALIPNRRSWIARSVRPASHYNDNLFEK
jgi:hypothetical protein